MTDAITVCNIGKAYKKYPSEWARFREWIVPGSRPLHSVHWVLEDISFYVPAGNALGIIGVNGAGKSTLLKMLTGTTKPTVGTIQIGGKVSALLELGMGFHADFTGRQNAYMSGQLLGLSVSEVDELMPKIEAFASIGDYMDQPIRVYSSGMQVRLAFSIATAVRPDVLIIDEALSVGDIEFQHRSFNLIRQFQKLGTTILLVSHDKEMIMSLCNQAMLLHKGRIEIQGDPEIVGNYYNAMLSDNPTQRLTKTIGDDGKVQIQSGTGEVRLDEIALLNDEGIAVDVVTVGQQLCLRVNVSCLEAIDHLVAGYIIKDRLGRDVFGTNTFLCHQQLHKVVKDEKVEYQFHFPMNIGPGSYSVSIALHADDTHLSKNYLWQDRSLIFKVINTNKDGFVGVAWVPPLVKIVR